MQKNNYEFLITPTLVKLNIFSLSSLLLLLLMFSSEIQAQQLRTVNLTQVINEPIAVYIITEPVNIESEAEQAVYLFIEVDGDEPYTFLWQKNEVDIANSNNDTIFFSNLAPADTGSYRCIVNNDCGIDTSDVAHLAIIVLYFEEVVSINLTGLGYGANVACGDYDNDNDIDILINGNDGTSRITKVYKNENNTFSEQLDINLPGVDNGYVEWGDYNNDGYLDLVITGNSDAGRVSEIYKNNSNNTFSEQSQYIIEGVTDSRVDWGDYNNDGLLDIVLIGASASGEIAKVYTNSNGSFIELENINLPGGWNGTTAEWGDCNNDGFLDILLTGWGVGAKVFINNQDNTFTSVVLENTLGNGYAAWGDYNNDGLLDVLLTGFDGNNSMSKVYMNNGDDTFTNQTGITLQSASNSYAAWGDYDKDGFLDILISGFGFSNSILYKNNGDNTFTENTEVEFDAVNYGSFQWFDYDNDNDLDLLLSGNDITKIYQNNNPVANTPNPNTAPSPPDNLNAEVLGAGKVTLTWGDGSDAQTPTLGLYYNVKIGRIQDGQDACTAMSGDNGYRRVVGMGNAMQSHIKTYNLEAGNYYWAVQSIDNGWMGSSWSEPQTFSIDGSEWVDIKPDASLDIIEMQYLNADVLIALTSNNRIYKTTSLGEEWELICPDVGISANNMRFINDSVGFLFDGLNGLAKKSTDGGVSWFVKSIPINTVSKFTFINQNHILAIGGNNIISSTDQGETWELMHSTPANIVNDIFVYDNQHFWTVGDSIVTYTSDGAQNWVDVNILNENITELNGIFFIDDNNGWLTSKSSEGKGKLFKTTDGGASWSKIYENNQASFKQIHFTTSTNGYMTWGVDSMTIHKTIDGGYTWEDEIYDTIYTRPKIKNIEVISDELILLSGLDNYGGTHTICYRKGETPGEFPSQISNTTDTLRSVFFLDDNLGWAVGDNGIVIKTINGGDDWVVVTSGTTERLNAVFFGDADNGWAVGDNGICMKTINGGDDWVISTSGTTERLMSVFFFDGNTGWFVGSNGVCMKSINGGDDWVISTSGTTERLMSVHFPSGNNGWAVGENGICLHTINGGDDWVISTSGTTERLYSVYFHDNDHGWIAGDNGILLVYSPSKSINEGGWVITTSGTTERLNAISFPTTDIGFATGDNGTVLKSTNGGGDWELTTSGTTERLMSVHFPSDNEGWVVGSNGIVMKFYLSVEVKSPVMGDNWQGGTQELIKWKKQNLNEIQIEYSIDNGTNWTLIADHIPSIAHEYQWNVPDEMSTDCLIRIANQSNTNVADTSGGQFEISRFAITSPNGGEDWNYNNTEEITWLKGNRDSIRLEFSVDTGNTWYLIVDSIPANSTSYTWDLPDSNSVYCMVKISDIKDRFVKDVSDTIFSLSIDVNIEHQGNAIKMLSYPNPSQGQIVIELQEDDISNARIEISDISGKLVESRIIENNKTYLDLSTYQKGIYFIKVSLKERSRTDRVIIR